jgi:hypothetical protein
LALFVVLLRLFDAPAFRWVALADLFAPPAPCVVAPTLEPLRFRFESFVSTFFILARTVLLDLRAARVLETGLLLPTRFRTLDEDAALEARFEVGFTRDAGPVLLVLELVGFFDLLRAAIANLSTREHFRTRCKSVHEHYSRSVHEHCSSIGELTFRQRNTCIFANDTERLVLDD